MSSINEASPRRVFLSLRQTLSGDELQDVYLYKETHS
jgi:hypothetical protein